jgi:membrane-bound lytic murein transglycosylase A
MFKYCFVLVSATYLAAAIFPSASANVPVWESWGNKGTAQAYRPGYQASQRGYAPARQGMPVYRQARYSSFADSNPLDCGFAQALNLPDRCIRKSDQTRQGLLEQVAYLQRLPLGKRVAPLWGNISNAMLLETVRGLLDWHDGAMPGRLQDHFSLREIQSSRVDMADYTGYFTPVLDVRWHPDGEFRIPVYRRPAGNLVNLSHAEIAHRALSGKGLELVWTNDAVNLFFAQVQGSGIARFPDGREMVLDYAGDNGRKFSSIADYMQTRGYRPRNLGNEAIRDWLHAHPEHIAEVLTANPRYVFFNLTKGIPKTASGVGVIPEHTIAVDHDYIPFGAVLLADVPRVDAGGRVIGSDWRLLFAQDRGIEIKGAGRLDLYMGAGPSAEIATHRVTGFRKAYMLVRR